MDQDLPGRERMRISASEAGDQRVPPGRANGDPDASHRRSRKFSKGADVYNVDIDTGGTMTDGLVSGPETFSVKVETTPHDLTISFLGVLQACLL